MEDTHYKDDNDDDNNNDRDKIRSIEEEKGVTAVNSSLLGDTTSLTTTTTTATSPILNRLSTTTSLPIGSTTTESNTTTATAPTTKVMVNMTEKADKIMNTPTSSIHWIKVIELCYAIPDEMIDYCYHDCNICFSCQKEQQQEQVDVLKDPSSSSLLSRNDNNNTNTNATTNTNTNTTTTTTYKVCGQCKVVKYCSRQCQITDWKKVHKHLCQSYQRMKLVVSKNNNETTTTTTTTRIIKDNNNNNDIVSVEPVIDIQSGANHNNSHNNRTNHATTNIQQQQQQQYYWSLKNNEMKTVVRNELFHKIRFYICPYAVIQYQELGRGIVYIQSNCTIDMISYTKPIYCNGRSMNMIRNCTIHYLTIGEYDLEICRNDFEMSIIQKDIHDIVTNHDLYNPLQQIVMVMKFRCGHVALGIAPLIPDYNICIRLGHDYNYNNNNNMLQLNLDE